ncbi:uncharacterized protein PV09_09254 [Verruconis gallopava]|uniref:Uncharacterized protein n=1 Tax=Verruconis gallopava TaxID=253628 RepID=A0A0D2AJE9_9PEZI|nr:uncharacterized protein PV09_09254 [Verruconis gallopava]KIV99028.1 hypothetical protein PV09_09254 [Verruconis gallopava]
MDAKDKASVPAPSWPGAFDAPDDQINPVKAPPFSEQILKNATSVPPVYGKEDEASRANHIENVDEVVVAADETNVADHKATKETRKQRIRRHCMRYWICYLIGNIILLAIMLPILFLVIFPAIAQDLVNKQALQLHYAELVDPAPQQMTFALNSSITVPKPFTVVLDKLNLSLFIRSYKPETPFVYLELPQNKLHGNATIDLAPQRANIVNSQQWLKFLNDSVYNETITLSAKGSSMGHFGALKAKLELDKDVQINGLNQLKGFGVESAQLLIPATTSGYNLKSTLQLPNHSPVMFTLGNQSFSLKIGTVVVGSGTIFDLTLVPNNNTATLWGNLDFGAVIENLEYILNTSASALAAGNLRLWTVGTTTIYNGQNIPYYEQILQGLVLQADIPITTLLVGSLGGYLNGSAAGLQNIVDTIPAALLNGSISVSKLQTALQQAYNNGTGSIANITSAIGTVFTEAGQLDIGGLFTAIGNAATAVTDGVATVGEIANGVGSALSSGVSTLSGIISALNLSALIPTAQAGPT